MEFKIIGDEEIIDAGYPTMRDFPKIKKLEKVGLWGLSIMEKVAKAQAKDCERQLEGLTPEGLRDELIEWITAYKDAAERNALAEDPSESADYLLSLVNAYYQSRQPVDRLQKVGEVKEILQDAEVYCDPGSDYRMCHPVVAYIDKLASEIVSLFMGEDKEE